MLDVIEAAKALDRIAEIKGLLALNAELVARLELYERVASDMLEVDEATGTDWYNLREARNLARPVIAKAKAEGQGKP